jgi:site-specific recombinase XerC
MLLLMLRCGLRVSEVSHVRWEAIDMAQGTLRVNTSKGQVDRVVYLSPDVAPAAWPNPALPLTVTRWLAWQRLRRFTQNAPFWVKSSLGRPGFFPITPVYRK